MMKYDRYVILRTGVFMGILSAILFKVTNADIHMVGAIIIYFVVITGLK